MSVTDRANNLNPKVVPIKKSLLTASTVNQAMKNAENCPVPKMCFSQFIHENELVILFADTNVGKSIVGVQAGDLASRGNPGEEFRYEPMKAKQVLYLDCELSEKQFQMRYSVNGTNNYQFSERFFVSRIDPEVFPENDFEVELFQALEQRIEDNQIEFLIIDNLTYLRTETEQSKNALPLMKQLKLLKSKYKLTVLVLAHTPKRDPAKPISRNDLAGSKALINFCDAAFAIGESFKDKSLRYLKQIKARATEVVYDADNVIVCEVVKDNNFLKFKHLGYGEESDHLKQSTNEQKKELQDAVIECFKKGLSEREIVSKLGGEKVINKSKVHRIIAKHKIASGSSEPTGS